MSQPAQPVLPLDYAPNRGKEWWPVQRFLLFGAAGATAGCFLPDAPFSAGFATLGVWVAFAVVYFCDTRASTVDEIRATDARPDEQNVVNS